MTGFRSPGTVPNSAHLYNVKVPGQDNPPNGPAFGGTPSQINDAGLLGPLQPLKLSGADWEVFMARMLVRTDRCEVRAPGCLAERWNGVVVGHLTRDQISLHHRQPRGMGGTKRYHVRDALARLVEQLPLLSAMGLLCGTGTTGCHGWVERNRELAAWFGWLVPAPVPGRSTAATDPAQVPVVLPDRRRVLLDEYGNYRPVPWGPYWIEEAA